MRSPDVHLSLANDRAVVWMPADLCTSSMRVDGVTGLYYALTLSQLIDLLDAGASAVLEWDKHCAAQEDS